MQNPETLFPIDRRFDRQDRNGNNFTLMRLLLALLVILSHSPELVDGDRHREILTRLFHTLSFGELAVNGFFLLSGFLIVQSWDSRPEFSRFIKKRILRIYPGFIVAVLVGAFVVGPLGSSDIHLYFSHFNWGGLKRIFLFHSIPIPPVFKDHPLPIVNGVLWTIAYEFRCYLLVALLGFFGMLRRRVWLTLTIATIILSLAPVFVDRFSFPGSEGILDKPSEFFRLFAFFSSGGCFYFFRDQLTYRMKWALMAAPIVIISLFQMQTAQMTLATLGAYIFFFLAFVRVPILDRFKSISDISYGVYLYGWPVQKLLLWYLPFLSPWALFPLACGASAFCGLLSWHFVERPFLRLKPK